MHKNKEPAISSHRGIELLIVGIKISLKNKSTGRAQISAKANLVGRQSLDPSQDCASG